MKRSNATCVKVEGLLPLFVGGDLEQEDNLEVGQHIEKCPACSRLSERASIARDELCRGLNELVAGSERQLWPAIREGLSREGLIPTARTGEPHTAHERSARADGAVFSAEGHADRHPPALGEIEKRHLFSRRNVRLVGGLAASLAVVFFVGQRLRSGLDKPASLEPSVAVSPALGSNSPALQGDTSLGLTAGYDSAQLVSDAVGGLRPVGLGETPLFDQARDQIRKEREHDSGGIFFKPMQQATSRDEGDLASSFSLQ